MTPCALFQTNQARRTAARVAAMLMIFLGERLPGDQPHGQRPVRNRLLSGFAGATRAL